MTMNYRQTAFPGGEEAVSYSDQAEFELHFERAFTLDEVADKVEVTISASSNEILACGRPTNPNR